MVEETWNGVDLWKWKVNYWTLTIGSSTFSLLEKKKELVLLGF